MNYQLFEILSIDKFEIIKIYDRIITIMVGAKIIVSGRVQGVCFRDYTQRWASSLGLTGWVKNLSDGRVEALVNGDEDNIRKLIKEIKEGPSIARVDNTDIEWSDYKGEFSDFKITW